MTDRTPVHLRRRPAVGTETEKAELEGPQMGRPPSSAGQAQPNYVTAIAREEVQAMDEHSNNDIQRLEQHETSGRDISTATELLDRQDLEDFITWWNNGDPECTLISNLGDLKDALKQSFGSSESEGTVYRPPLEVEQWIDRSLLVIEDSFRIGLKRVLTRWAQETLRSTSLRETSPAPFRSLAEWLQWSAGFGLPALLENWKSIHSKRRHGLVISNPYSCPIFSDEVEEALAVHALIQNIGLAHEHGWLAKGIV